MLTSKLMMNFLLCNELVKQWLWLSRQMMRFFMPNLEISPWKRTAWESNCFNWALGHGSRKHDGQWHWVSVATSETSAARDLTMGHWVSVATSETSAARDLTMEHIAWESNCFNWAFSHGSQKHDGQWHWVSAATRETLAASAKICFFQWESCSLSLTSMIDSLQSGQKLQSQYFGCILRYLTYCVAKNERFIKLVWQRERQFCLMYHTWTWGCKSTCCRSDAKHCGRALHSRPDHGVCNLWSIFGPFWSNLLSILRLCNFFLGNNLETDMLQVWQPTPSMTL